MPPVAADQSALQCPTCAGQCSFSPVHQALACRSCGHLTALETDMDHLAGIEYGYLPETPEAEHPVALGDRTHACQTCGGEVVFTGNALSERCPYCDGAVVISDRDSSYLTKALIPFKADADFAQRQAINWARNRRAAPGDLGTVVARGRVAGIYAPFWTFDTHEAVKYWAKYTTGSGDNRRTHSTTGDIDIVFDDLLMPASSHVTPLIRDGILHDFEPTDLRPYKPGYLAGFAAQRHHQSVAQGLAANKSDKGVLIRNRIKRHINKSGVHSIRYNTDTTGIHYRRILLPVWMLHYTYADKPMKVVVSGIDGRTFGERPFSKWKLAGYSAVLSGIAMAAGILWGSAGLL